MKYFLFVLILFLELREHSTSVRLYEKPVPQIVKDYGYPSETHSILTEDGYNLTLHRIPYGKNCKKGNSIPVLMGHGMYASSLNWMLLGPEYSLGNSQIKRQEQSKGTIAGLSGKGNCYSRGHRYLNVSEGKYWDFSVHEIGFYDISAAVDHIVQATKQDNVLFVGYSETSTAGLINAILRPQTKIKAMFLMAPIFYLRKSTSSIKTLSLFEPFLTYATQPFGNREINLKKIPLQFVVNLICQLIPKICRWPLSVCGFDERYVNKTLLPTLHTHVCGISIKQLFHFTQGFKSDFSQYNYGYVRNRQKYGRFSPPRYEPKKIKKPVYLYYSENDLCADTKDVKRLGTELGNNLAGIYAVEDPSFGHASFALHVSVKELVYDVILAHMKEVIKSGQQP